MECHIYRDDIIKAITGLNRRLTKDVVNIIFDSIGIFPYERIESGHILNDGLTSYKSFLIRKQYEMSRRRLHEDTMRITHEAQMIEYITAYKKSSTIKTILFFNKRLDEHLTKEIFNRAWVKNSDVPHDLEIVQHQIKEGVNYTSICIYKKYKLLNPREMLERGAEIFKNYTYTTMQGAEHITFNIHRLNSF